MPCLLGLRHENIRIRNKIYLRIILHSIYLIRCKGTLAKMGGGVDFCNFIQGSDRIRIWPADYPAEYLVFFLDITSFLCFLSFFSLYSGDIMNADPALSLTKLMQKVNNGIFFQKLGRLFLSDIKMKSSVSFAAKFFLNNL